MYLQTDGLTPILLFLTFPRTQCFSSELSAIFLLVQWLGNTFTLSQLMRIATVICFLCNTLLIDLATSRAAKTQRKPSHITSILKVRRDMGHDQADFEVNNETPARNMRFRFCVGALGNSDCYSNIYFAGVLAQGWLAILESTCFKQQELLL